MKTPKQSISDSQERYKLMEEERKIKDIYDCNYILSDGALYPLQKWYNQVLDKRISDINVFDVLRMIRQNEFLDIALPKAIEYLKDNPFIGDMYEGETAARPCRAMSLEIMLIHGITSLTRVHLPGFSALSGNSYP